MPVESDLDAKGRHSDRWSAIRAVMSVPLVKRVMRKPFSLALV